MKQITFSLIVAFIIALGLQACKMDKAAVTDAGKTADPPAATAQIQNPAAAPAAAESIEPVLGSYVGQFGDNKITLLVTKAGGGVVSGRSIVGGNDRPFDGTVTLDNGTYNFEGREPGDDKNDGVFKFHIAQAKPDEVTGTWKPNDAKRPEKTYTLERRKFEYKASVGSFPEASQRSLKPEDVENLTKGELKMMRNEIFARHGYCFSRKEMRQQFENEDWYVPNTVDIRGSLTDLEKNNIAMIKRYEKYADEYGDEYGR